MGRRTAPISWSIAAAFAVTWLSASIAFAQERPASEIERPAAPIGGGGLGPIEPGQPGIPATQTPGTPRTDAEAAGLRPGVGQPGRILSPADRERQRAEQRRNPTANRPAQAPLPTAAGVTPPPPAARQPSSRPAPVANRRTGRLPRTPAIAGQLPRPGALRPIAPPPGSRRPVDLAPSREDRRALATGLRGVTPPNQPQRPVDVPIVVERVQPINGRVLPNANPIGRNALIDPRTGEIVSYDRTPRTEADPFAPTGLRLGSFIVTPQADLTTGYDSNPRRVPTPGAGSWLGQVSADVLARSDWVRHEVTARLRGSYSAFFQAPDVNRVEGAATLTGRFDVSRDTRLEGELRSSLSVQAAGSANLPTVTGSQLRNLPFVRQYGATGAIVQDFDRLQLTMRGTIDRSTFDNAVAANGTVVDQSTRAFTAYGTRLRTSYEIIPGLRPFVEAGYERRVFDIIEAAPTPPATTGPLQGATQLTLRAGSTFEFTRLLTGEASVGVIQRRNVDPSFRPVYAPTFDANLVWTLSALTTIRFGVRSLIDESFVVGAAGIERREVTAELEHSFQRWLTGTARLTYGVETYLGSNPFRRDQRLVGSLALVYRATRELQIRGEVRREQLISNLTGSSFAANVVLFGIRLQR